jgi:DivIVA domain-containing protein
MVNVEGSLSADLIAQQNFSPARRGFDPDEVRAFLVKVGAEIMALHERQAALEDARRDAEYRAAHPSFDEETLFGAVGEETAHILKSAHDAAADIKSRAGENASRILKDAHAQAEVLLAEAETVLSRRTEEAEAIAVRIKEAAKAEAERLLDQSRQQSKAIRAQAEAERNAMIEGAQATREKILSALSKKRNVAVAQVEQLRAGRERLLEAYQVVRETLDEATAELARAETEARAAADAIRHRPLALDEPDGLQEEGDPPTNPTLPIIQKRLRQVDSQSAHPPMTARPAPPAPPAAATVPPPSLPTASPPPPPPAPAPLPKPSAAPPPARPVEASVAPPTASVPTPLAAEVQEAAAPKPPNETPERAPKPEMPESGAELDPAEGRRFPGDPAPVGVGAEPHEEEARKDEPPKQEPRTVESLFARIRADREKALAHAKEVLTDDRPVPDDEALLQKRDEALEPIEAGLTRRLKRALQDDQNDLLDRLRNVRMSQKAAAVVLPSREAHAARFHELSRPFLGEAMNAGVRYTAAMIPGLRATDHLSRVDALAERLAEAIVDPLRRRLESVLVDGEGDDPVILAEAVGAAYREWKTKRVETAAADHVAAAFTQGVYAATPASATLRWLVDDADGPCSDCDDNALSGAQPKGEAYPTGQRYPPAHPGCRCLLVPQRG